MCYSDDEINTNRYQEDFHLEESPRSEDQESIGDHVSSEGSVQQSKYNQPDSKN